MLSSRLWVSIIPPLPAIPLVYGCPLFLIPLFRWVSIIPKKFLLVISRRGVSCFSLGPITIDSELRVIELILLGIFHKGLEEIDIKLFLLVCKINNLLL